MFGTRLARFDLIFPHDPRYLPGQPCRFGQDALEVQGIAICTSGSIQDSTPVSRF